jgi:hypothetical protein
MVSKQEYWDFSSAIAERALDWAARDPVRWVDLVSHFPHLPPAQRDRMLEGLSQLNVGGPLGQRTDSETPSVCLGSLGLAHR